MDGWFHDSHLLCLEFPVAFAQKKTTEQSKQHNLLWVSNLIFNAHLISNSIDYTWSSNLAALPLFKSSQGDSSS